MNAYLVLASPIGPLLLTASDQALTGIEFPPHRRHPSPATGWTEGGPVVAEAGRQLEAYFAGERFEFDLPLEPRGNPFHQRVWTALRGIPYGATASYGEIARALVEPGAARAVGVANARNPLPVIVPCHRVIGSDGSLTGYGGGIERKRWLLAHEQRFAARNRDAVQGVLLEPA